MEERGMTEGHAALIFRTPENDMSLIYKAIVSINERLLVVRNLPKDDTTYQVALDDLRGTARELNLFAADWFAVSNWMWTRLGSFVTFILGAVLLVKGIM